MKVRVRCLWRFATSVTLAVWQIRSKENQHSCCGQLSKVCIPLWQPIEAPYRIPKQHITPIKKQQKGKKQKFFQEWKNRTFLGTIKLKMKRQNYALTCNLRKRVIIKKIIKRWKILKIWRKVKVEQRNTGLCLNAVKCHAHVRNFSTNFFGRSIVQLWANITRFPRNSAILLQPQKICSRTAAAITALTQSSPS